MATDSPRLPSTSPLSEGTIGVNGMTPTAATTEETVMVAFDDFLPTDATLASDIMWTKEINKQFEDTLANFDDFEAPSVWSEVSAMVPGTNAALVQERFEMLQKDLQAIFTGKIAVPDYDTSMFSLTEGEQSDAPTSKKQKVWAGQSPGGTANGTNGTGNGGKSASNKADQERRKGIPWSEDEHRLFLLGLKKFGKGDWRSISRNYVISRTPTQVASHAQKYFIRLNSINKDKRRSSIHDITSVNGNGGEALQGSNIVPITGQSPPSATTPAGPPGYYGFHGAPAAQMPFGQMQRAMPMMSRTPMMAAYPMSQQAMKH